MTYFWVFIKYSLASVLTIAAGFSFALTIFVFSDNINHKILFSSAIVAENSYPSPIVAALFPVPTVRTLVSVEDSDDDDDGDCS